MNKRLKVMSMIVGGVLAIAGCVSVESVKNQMSSSSPADVAAGEKEIFAIATTGKSSNGLISFKNEERLAFVKMATGKPVAWKIAEELTKDSFTFVRNNGDSCMYGNVTNLFIESLKGCVVTDKVTAERLIEIVNRAKISNQHGDKPLTDASVIKAAEKLPKEDLWRLFEKQRYGSDLYFMLAEVVAKNLENDADAQKLLQKLGGRCSQMVMELAAAKITDPSIIMKMYFEGLIDVGYLAKIKDENKVVEWLVAHEGKDRYGQFQDNVTLKRLKDIADKCVKSDSEKIALTKAQVKTVRYAAIDLMSKECFIKFVKENNSPELFDYRLEKLTSKDDLLELLNVVKDNGRVVALSKHMKKVGVDVGVVAMSATEYSDVAFWTLFETKDDEVLKKIAKEHKLKLLRYMALERIDKAGAAAMVSAEAAKVKPMTGTGTVEGFGIGMSLEDAFFLAKKTFPESQPEVWRESGNTFRVVVADGEKFTFATADYDSGKVFRLNFTPSMTKRLVGGATFDEQNRLIARKYGFVLKFEMISAHLKIDNAFLKFLCNDDDDKWSVAHQVVYQQLGTDGVRIRYFEDERKECVELGRLLATNTAFREFYKDGWETPEQVADKLAKKCANDFETVLGLPGTLRIEKTK